MDTPLSWLTSKRKVKDLVEYKGNPRKISDKQMEGLKKSLTKFSLAEIPAVNSDGTVLAGNQRLRALMLMGKADEEIDVRVPNRKLTAKEAKEYLLLSNRSGGDWDWEALQTFDPDFLMDLGFDEDDFSRIWDDALEIIDDDFNVEKALKKAKATDIKVGDMFQMGSHRVICGDSQDLEVIKRLLGTVKVDAVNTDVPYNIGLSYDKGIGQKQAYGGSTNDKKTDEEYRAFLGNLIKNARASANSNAHFAFWSDERYNGMVQDLFKEYGIDFKRTCLWVKSNQNPTPKIAFNKSVEYCTYGATGKPFINEKVQNLTEIMNKEVGTGGRQIADIIDLFNIWLVDRAPTSEYSHPTQKPPALYEKFLRRVTKPGDKVLDLTAGSGSLMIACEQMKRTAYLAEIEPIFTQLIIDRYANQTGHKAKKIN